MEYESLTTRCFNIFFLFLLFYKLQCPFLPFAILPTIPGKSIKDLPYQVMMDYILVACRGYTTFLHCVKVSKLQKLWMKKVATTCFKMETIHTCVVSHIFSLFFETCFHTICPCTASYLSWPLSLSVEPFLSEEKFHIPK